MTEQELPTITLPDLKKGSDRQNYFADCDLDQMTDDLMLLKIRLYGAGEINKMRCYADAKAAFKITKSQFDTFWKQVYTTTKGVLESIKDLESIPLDQKIIFKNTDATTTLDLDSGIYLTQLIDDISQTIQIYKWTHFEIKLRYKDQEEWMYQFLLNGDAYMGTLAEMKERLDSQYSYQRSGYKTSLNTVLNLYIDTIPISERERMMGFTAKGWRFPPQHLFAFVEGSHVKMHDKLKTLFSIPLEEKDYQLIKRQVQNLYESTTIPYKGIIWSWGLIAVFMQQLCRDTALKFYLCLSNTQNTTFKSAAIRMITCKFYGHMKDIVNASKFNYSSQVDGLMTGCTAPFGLDEADQLNETQLPKVKGNTTSAEQTTSRKGKGKAGQGYSLDEEYCNVMAMSFNKAAKWFEDTAFLTRILNLIIERAEANPRWKLDYDALPDGYFWRYLVKYTETWTPEYLWERLHNTPIPTDLDDRGVKIYRMLYLGKEILLEIFGIDVDLTGLKEAIQQTVIYGSETTIEYLKEQIRFGSYQINANDCNTGIFDPRPCETWIKSPVCTTMYKGKECYTITLLNTNDLQRKMENRTDWTLELVYQRLKASILGPYIAKDKVRLFRESEKKDGRLMSDKMTTNAILIPKEKFRELFGDKSTSVLNPIVYEPL